MSKWRMISNKINPFDVAKLGENKFDKNLDGVNRIILLEFSAHF